MKLLVDGDYLVYLVGFKNETKYYNAGDFETFNTKREVNEHIKENGLDADMIGHTVKVSSLSKCKKDIDNLIAEWVQSTEAKETVIYLGGKDNFRKEIFSEYKKNRNPCHRPFHYKGIKDYLVTKYDAQYVNGCEADDALGIEQIKALEGNEESCILSIDKDLNMIPGKHYDLRSGEIYFVDEDESIRTFYCQLLTGDSSDNIPGIRGIGPKKSEKIISECKTDKEMWDTCIDKWSIFLKDKEDVNVMNYVLDIARLLWIQRYTGEVWEPPV